MLARIQQALTLGALVLVLAWIWWALEASQPALAICGVLLIISAHAIVLGIECVLLRRVHGADSAPLASGAQLLAAWWGENRAAPAVFCWRQPFRSQHIPDHLPADGEGRNGVLFIHGFVCNRGLWNPWLASLKRNGTPFVAVNLEPVFGSIDDYVPRIEAAAKQLERCTGCSPLVVAHSMGGLALRRWWVEQRGPAADVRVRHAITIGTPHQGTWLDRFALTRNAQQMQQGSAWLQALKAREPAWREQRFTCFYSHCDNIVFPASNATLPGADNRHIPAVAHVHMVERPEPWGELQRLLNTTDPRRG